MDDRMLDSLHLEVTLKPMIALGASQPFAWQAVATASRGRSFSAAAAALPPELRISLEARRITLAVERAVAAGLLRSDALLAVPVGAAGGKTEPLLSHLFRTALAHRFPVDRLVVEVSADERGDRDSAAALIKACMARGLSVALDAFAAGPVALNLLARFTPRFVKLDGTLVRRIDASASRRPIVEGVMRLARGMGVTVVATGVETRGELEALAALGLCHVQGDWTAEPAVRTLTNPALLRREPRATVPQHRRLAHHHRASLPLRTTCQVAQLAL
ncbi:EAL domain-containing protein [Sphingomonas sp. JC676]|uniref:EAL domain-containing protein n=1 Tax=Sphingomonas sp. JC676 TaxID=2768065 RepID=UPI001657E946|nr:EAL domain-containing protein [Sphingomonas sp. JC676]MBC9034009.1 EAL domain-containing protein [Sphingomonas sp. JC676]